MPPKRKAKSKKKEDIEVEELTESEQDFSETDVSEGEEADEDESIIEDVDESDIEDDIDEDSIDKDAFKKEYNKKKEDVKKKVSEKKKEDYDDDESEGERMLKNKNKPPPSRFGDVSADYVVKLDNPYVKTELAKTVTLKPREQTSDLIINLKKSLIKDLSGKIYKDFGFVKKIYKIVSSETGRIKPEEFNGDVIFDVKFYAKICKPEKDDIISAQIDSIGDKFIRCSNGPMNIFIGYKFVDYEVFCSSESNSSKGGLVHSKSKRSLQIGDYVKIKILKLELQPGNTSIIIIGYLMDFIK